MLAPRTLQQLLAERARRLAATTPAKYERITAAIRGEYHPKQGAFARSQAEQEAAICTRRSGKSRCIIAEMLCTALEEPNSHQVYINETKHESKRIAWRGAKNKDGFIPLLQRFGMLGEVRTNKTELSITFANGALIELFGADDADQMEKLRGGAYRRVVVDEAQKIVHLQELVEGVLQPAMRDQFMETGRAGQIWLTGTPSQETAGYFYDVTNDEEPLAGWEVHRWSVSDNPYFGATPEIRWANTAGAILAKNRWTGSEPKFQREWLGKWVKEDARYVYHANRMPEHRLVFAPLRMHADGSYDHERALADLPQRTDGRKPRRIEWMSALGVDLGYDPGAFALVLWAYSHDHPDVYEMWSWKMTGLVPDVQREAIDAIRSSVPLTIMVGDPGGLGKGELEGWRERHGLPIDDAEKTQKRTWMEFFNGDITSGRVRLREGSPLLHEMKHLMWAPIKARRAEAPGVAIAPKEWANRKLKDGSVPGNHCCDAGLYAYRHLTHYLHRAPEDLPEVGSPEWFRREEQRMEDEIDEYDPDQQD